MKKHQDIFNDSSLSKDELKHYLDGNLSEQEKINIEKKIAANDFSMDAVEGFENNPAAFSEFKQLSDDFHGNLPRKTNNSGKWKFQYSFIIIMVLAIGTYFIGAYFLKESEKKREAFDERRKLEKEEIAQKIEKEEFELKNVAPVIELSDNEIDSAISLPVEKQLLSHLVIVESPIKIDLDTINIELRDQSIQNAKDVKERVNIDPIHKISPNTSIDRNIVQSNTKTLYLSELLVVDYSMIYQKGIEKKSIQLPGVSADKANEDDTSPNDLSIETHTEEIIYIDFLRAAQEKFRKNKFKEALKEYKLILRQYPNDINAHFYSGLCYYNINKLNIAIEHFDRTINHEFNTFQEEALWYKALCLYESGQTSKCITLLNKIANSSGFYAVNASKLLEKI